jgi:ribosomal protein S18 acetylase RimI-like enzyme
MNCRKRSNRPIRVRRAVGDDLTTIKGLRDALYREYPAPPWRDESWETHEVDIVRVIREGGGAIAITGKDPAGYALAWLEGSDAVKLGDLFVRPVDRRCGIGRSLVRFVADFARARGAAYITLNANLAAVRFYDRLSFTEQSRTLSAAVEAILRSSSSSASCSEGSHIARS